MKNPLVEEYLRQKPVFLVLAQIQSNFRRENGFLILREPRSKKRK